MFPVGVSCHIGEIWARHNVASVYQSLQEFSGELLWPEMILLQQRFVIQLPVLFIVENYLNWRKCKHQISFKLLRHIYNYCLYNCITE